MEKTIDVEKIMQEIREDIIKKGYTNDMLSFQEIQSNREIVTVYNENECKAILHNINSNHYVAWYREIPETGIKKFMKKVIRKFCAFLIAPTSEQQTLFNGEVAQEFNQIVAYIEELENQKETYEKNMEMLEEKIEKLELEIKALRE